MRPRRARLGCPPTCTEAVLAAGYATIDWLAAPSKWNGSAVYRGAILTQGLPQTIAGLDADQDVRAPGSDIGDFVPFGVTPSPIPSPVPPLPYPAVPSFSQDGYATWYADQTNADPAWPNVNNLTDMTAAHAVAASPFGASASVAA